MFKDIGALAEIGAKVGDVVEWGGIAYEVLDGMMLWSCRFNGDARRYEEIEFPYGANFRIIYRAQPTGTVITETVTRKRIVPGVYGRVVVERESNGDMVIDARNMQVAAELTAAIETLTAIRDAMENNA